MHETHRGKAHPSTLFGRNSEHFSRDAAGKGLSTGVARAQDPRIFGRTWDPVSAETDGGGRKKGAAMTPDLLKKAGKKIFFYFLMTMIYDGLDDALFFGRPH